MKKPLTPHAPLPLLYRILSPLILAFATVATYYPSLSYEFQFDDIANITRYFEIRHNSFWKLFFSGTRWISYWINSLHYKVGKFAPFSYRVGNMLLHSLNGILIFFIILTLLQHLRQQSFFKRNAFAIAFTTALLFLLHPVQTQTISYVIQGQLEGLSAFFALVLILGFALFFNKKRAVLAYLFCSFFYGIAILATGTKEIFIVAPFLLVVVDWFFVAQGSSAALFKRWWFHLGTLVAVTGCYIWFLKPSFFIDLFTFKMKVGNNLGNIITSSVNEDIFPYTFFISQFKVILHYLWIFIWPANISVEYDWILSKSFWAVDCFFPFLILMTALGFLAMRVWHNRVDPVAFGAFWFAICLMPRSSIMPSPELLVDYKTYLASLGWLFILACFFVFLAEKIPTFSPRFHRFRFASPALVLPLALLLSFGTIRRNLVWKSSLNFWENVVDNAPGKARVFNNYGVELSQKKKMYAESIKYFEHAIEIDPDYRDPYNNLAVAYAATKQLDKAIAVLQKSLEKNRYYPEAYNNIASFLIEKEYEQAKRALSYAIQLRPHYGKAHFNLGRAFIEEGNLEKAWESFKQACMQADLDDETGFSGYAKISLLLKKYDDTIFACKKILELNPSNHDAVFTLAQCYTEKKEFDAAERHYKALLAKFPQDSQIRYNLAETYFNAEKTAAALQAFEPLKKVPGISPNLFIRIATCYEKLGNPQNAQRALKELLTKNLPLEDKNSVNELLSKLNERYRLT